MKTKLVFFILFAVQSVFAFDHSYTAWQNVIRKYVDYTHVPVSVDYLGIKADRKDFSTHLQEIVKVKEVEYAKFTHEQKQAFILNAYGALAIKVILDQTQNQTLPRSIKSDEGLWTKIFDKKFFKLFGEQRSLNYLEHELGKDYSNDLKFVFSLACTAKKCPPPAHYTPEKLNENEKENLRIFLKDEQNVRYDFKENKFFISEYFQDREEQIKKSGQSLKHFLVRHMSVTEQLKDKAIRNENTSAVEYMKMDWSLNKK